MPPMSKSGVKTCGSQVVCVCANSIISVSSNVAPFFFTNTTVIELQLWF